MRYKTLLLIKKTVKKLVTIKESLKAIEDAFRSLGQGGAQMPPKIYIHLDKYSGDFRAMPAYLEGPDKCALKWVNVHPLNKKRGLPSVMGIIILSDPKNGFPLCIMDGTYVTNFRTGAAGGVAAKYLARKNSETVSLVGCGAQAETQLMALKELFKIKEIKVWGHEKRLIKDFIERTRRMKLRMYPADTVRECVKNSDIIVTTTPSRKPLIKHGWLKKGAHINAIGADAPGKEELDPKILKHSKIVVDSLSQAAHSGEINVPLKKGIISKRNIYSDIGQIVSGKKPGRTNDKETTIFDSTGLAIQDVAMSSLIYKKAVRRHKGTYIDLIG